jgi:hypothetical protein
LANRDLTRITIERRYRREEFSQVGGGGNEGVPATLKVMCSQLEPIVKKIHFFVGKVDKLRWRDDTSILGFFSNIFWVFLFGRNKNCHPQPPTGSIPPVHLNRFKFSFSFCVSPLRTYNFYPDGTITLVFFAPMCNIQKFKFQVRVCL